MSRSFVYVLLLFLDWFPNEINDGFVERFLFLLAFIMFCNLILYALYTHGYVYARYTSRTVDVEVDERDAAPTVDDILGRLSDVSTEPEPVETSLLFPSDAARQEARLRSYGSPADFESIFPTRASLVEAQRRALGTSKEALLASHDSDVTTRSDEDATSGRRMRGARRKNSRLRVSVHGTVSEENECDVTSSC